LLAWRELESQGREAIRELIKTDRYYLLVKVLRRKDALHPWVYARCREVEAAPDGYLDVWAREHFKSSIITVAGSIQEVLRDPDITIGIFSHTKPIAKAFLATIKREFEANTVLKTLFPEIFYEDPERQSPSWSLDNGIIVKRKSNPNVATIEAHGLVDGQPTSKHFRLLLYDDVVTDTSVYTPEQIQKTTEAWSLSDNLGSIGGRKWYVGTRYCSAGNMRVLMGDWSHRPIQDVKVGDTVVGWELRNGKRWLRRARVVNRGMHPAEPVNRYVMAGGRSVVCTADHRWWRGAHGGGPEYAPLALPRGPRKDRPPKGKKVDGAVVALRQLLIPTEPSTNRAAPWLAGFFDGEGCIKKNQRHPSGSVQITQTMHNPDLIDETRRVLSELRFKWSEFWVTPKNEKWNKRCAFMINGGWSERYRFLAEVSPVRREKLSDTLYGQLMTDRQKLLSVEPAGVRDVHWLETETGNYVIEGFCSSNSFADTYAEIIKRGAAIPRVYPATDDGTPDGKPVLFTQKDWENKKKNQLESTLACQLLCNPMAGHQRMFNVEDLQVYEVRPLTLMAYLLVDPARSVKKESANTAMVVIGVDSAANKYLLDGVDHKMDLMDRWKWMRDLWAKWQDAPGIMGISVGYERFGAIADLDYFKERQRVEGARFEIVELEWPRDGEGSKKDRIQRLVPDVRGHRFYLPYPTDDRRLTSVQQRMVAQGYEYRLSQQIRRPDENGHIYDLAERFRLQISYFPFGGLKDVIDATSRIYDIDPVTPQYVDQSSLEPEWT
jgi:LAGLIDADG-like domain